MSTENIDWSKSPAGTTHFDPESRDLPWEKREGDIWYYWDRADRRWESFSKAGDSHLERYPQLVAKASSEALAAWSGEGRPPVGTACEWLQGSSHQWERIEILAYNGADAWIRQESGRGLIVGNIANLRPLRTPEQIEAEERESAAKQICVDAGSPELTAGQMAIAYRLYDAGYRKVDPAGAQP